MAPLRHGLAKIKMANQKSQSQSLEMGTWGDMEKSLTIEEVNNSLSNLVRIMENDPKRALPALKGLLSRIPKSGATVLMSWNDQRGFDVLHAAIVHNIPGLIEYLLNNASLFPQTFYPNANPYAHLAAMLGFKSCLEAVLTYRPRDNFKGSDDSHMIVLPVSLVQQLNLNKPKKRMTNFQNLDALLKSIKKDTALAEEVIEGEYVEDLELEDEIEHEMKALKKSLHKKININRRYLPLKMSTPKDSKNTAITFSGLPTPRLPGKEQASTPLKLPSVYLRNPKVVKPKITVYWDIFKDQCEGVVRGAGEKVELQYCEDTHHHKLPTDPRPNTDANDRNSQARRDKEEKTKTDIFSLRKSSLIKQRTASMRPRSTIIDDRSLSKIELGVRWIKKYKSFAPIIQHKPQDVKYKDYFKTPLTYAAEKGHIECVHYLLRFQRSTRGQLETQKQEPLSAATSARSPEALALLLREQWSRLDYQSAILISIRELYPDCLSVLLNFATKERSRIFGGSNLFHLLYSQSLGERYRYEMLPEMTRVLIRCREDVNARVPNSTYPLYTLIQCAFNITTARHYPVYLTCLKLLMAAKANPHYNERKVVSDIKENGPLSRPSYTSAVQCVMSNACNSIHRFPKTQWVQILMLNFLESIERNDRTPRRVDNNILFYYIEQAPHLGFNRAILRCLLRFGSNPDSTMDGKYPLNIFFDEMFPFLTKFEIIKQSVQYEDMLAALLILCRSMTTRCLHEAVVQFLDSHLFSTPLQALSLTRQFCYHTNKLIMFPRSLAQLVSHKLWIHIGRNPRRVLKLPIPTFAMHQIIP